MKGGRELRLKVKVTGDLESESDRRSWNHNNGENLLCHVGGDQPGDVTKVFMPLEKNITNQYDYYRTHLTIYRAHVVLPVRACDVQHAETNLQIVRNLKNNERDVHCTGLHCTLQRYQEFQSGTRRD